ncbi:MAG: aminotransferase class I/II-fold pyridoxal phosphate-dependent enzyme [Gammaproteobacteria bacterium]|nr:aminotransferase class I/II-fold pyridoxal phosphate-dependent enzyme [Gammaproteobacteria bacterium]
MSLSVSKRMAAIKPSPTAAVLALATELRAAGRDIISLGAGEPDFDTPQHIKDAAQKAIRDGKTKYTPIDGTAELKAAIQQKFLRENQLEYAASQIIVSSGAKQCLFNLCMGLLSPGDEAIIPAPYWVSYPDMVKLAGAEPVIVESGIDADFKITPEQLASSISDRTRLFILNSPSNPTGASYSAAELQELGAILSDHPDIVIVADDIYEHIHWGDDPFCSFAAACPDLYDRVVTTNGVSKAYAMTGWRIGYAAGPAELITAMKTVQSQSTSNPCSISQAAAVAALSGDQACVKQMTAAYKERHDYVVHALNSIDGFECRPGEGTFYALPRIVGALDRMHLAADTDFVTALINDADVACVPGSAFGAPGYIRLSFACSMEMLEEATNRMKRLVST